MPSSDNAARSPAGSARAFKEWNARLHYYLGLYLLCFVWLFAFTGLLLNHGSWAFAEFWPNRKVAKTEQAIQVPAAGSNLETARQLMRQLGIAGEIQWLATPPSGAKFDFRVTRPGLQFDVSADLAAARAKIERTELNAWGAMRILHTFTGVRVNDPKNQRDWLLTTMWALAMDAVALGLIVMVAGGVLIWLQSKTQRLAGWLALGSGIAVCGWFLFGLAARLG